MSQSFHSAENKESVPQLKPLYRKQAIPENLSVNQRVCKRHDLEKGINIETELKTCDILSERSKEDNLTSDNTSLTLTNPKNCSNQQFTQEQPKESQLLDQNKITKSENQYESITSSQSHTFVIINSPSTETKNNNSILNASPFRSLKNNIPSCKSNTSLYNPVTKIKAFHFRLLSKNNTVQRIIINLKTKFLHSKNKNTNEKTTMWNSRNRILIDADGDDVAFLSGSGRTNVYNILINWFRSCLMIYALEIQDND